MAAFAVTSAFSLAFALNTAFYGVLGDRVQLSILRHAPCGAVKGYVGYVLEDKDGIFRASWEKMTILDLLVQAEDQGARVCYDALQVLPYLDESVALRYPIAEEEPLGRLAENLVLKRGDPDLIKAAMDRYRTRKPQVTRDLCWRLETEKPATEGYMALRTAYCPARKPPPPEPALTPEERHRKKAFDQILEDSRRGRL